MESKCDRCNTKCPEDYFKKGIMTNEYLCPDCYKLNKVIISTIIFCSVCILGIIATAIWG